MFNKRLKQIRNDKGYTQKQVADGIHIPERQYQYYEYGQVKPSFDTLIALADYFNVSIDYLVGRTDER